MDALRRPRRTLIFHPRIEPLGLVLKRSDVLAPLTRSEKNELDEKLTRYAAGNSRRNSDHKRLAGFSDWGLIEIRWEWTLAGKRVPIRLIGAEQDRERTVFCVWHVKNLDMDLDRQREKQNESCSLAVERMIELANPLH